MTRRSRLFAAALLCLIGCTHARLRAALVPGGFTILRGAEAAAVLDQCSHYAPKGAETWQPDEAAIVELERGLPGFLAKQRAEAKTWPYFRQYAGVVDSVSHRGRPGRGRVLRRAEVEERSRTRRAAGVLRGRELLARARNGRV